ncbi:DNA-directed RNA polymerases I [Glugoides intestinalis]
MQIVGENYKVVEIKNTSFDKVPRAILQAASSKIAADYHSDLCDLKLKDMVKVVISIGERPVLPKSTYLMHGTVYKIEENRLEISCGGLLLFYEGPIIEELAVETDVYVSFTIV